MPAGNPLVVRFTNYCGLWGGAGGRFASAAGALLPPSGALLPPSGARNNSECKFLVETKYYDYLSA